MSMQSIPVVPFTSGLEKDKEPFLLGNDAFPSIYDAYIYQGRVERKKGNRFLGRLVQIIEDGALGNVTADPFVFNIFTLIPAIGILGIQPYSVTITIAAVPSTYTDDGLGVLSDGGSYGGTIDYITGDVSITVDPLAIGTAATITLNYYTGRPVMGLFTKEEETITSEGLMVFDTVKANLWNRGEERFEDISFDTSGSEVKWTSTDSDFFWATNYYRDASNNNLFWATNNIQNSLSGAIAQDGIMIYNTVGWEQQVPQLNSSGSNRFLNGCLILIPYRNRMVALNTLESSARTGVIATRHSNRARWCQNGVPYTDVLGGFQANSWNDDVSGKGGYIDAPTNEAIVSCGFYKDVLVVFFERSTWQLTYTGEYGLPFVWNKVNTDLGCESTHSTITFDKGIFAVGDKAIVMSDSYNVERIDNKIPLEVYSFHNQNDGAKRVYGIRDFYYRFAYWSFPNSAQNGTYPNRMLVLNYDEGAYSIFNDSYTCFGYYQSFTDLTWEKATFSWESATFSWNSNRIKSDYPDIVGGNQVGFVMVLNYGATQDTSLYITGITQASEAEVTAPNHNLIEGQFVKFSSVQGMTEINDLTGKIVEVTGTDSFKVDIDSTAFSAYTISGFISVLSNIEITTKRYNPFFVEGSNARINYVDMLVSTTPTGVFNLSSFIDTNNTEPIEIATIETYQNYGIDQPKNKMWQRVYFNTDGQFVQFKIGLSDEQMKDSTIQPQLINIHVMNIYVNKTGNLLGYN